MMKTARCEHQILIFGHLLYALQHRVLTSRMPYILEQSLMFWKSAGSFAKGGSSAQMQKSCNINDTVFFGKSQYILRNFPRNGCRFLKAVFVECSGGRVSFYNRIMLFFMVWLCFRLTAGLYLDPSNPNPLSGEQAARKDISNFDQSGKIPLSSEQTEEKRTKTREKTSIPSAKSK